MKIATWNVNSVRARMERLLPWLEERAPDVVCLQETKVTDDAFPREPIEELGYEVVLHGQKTYNGVAILSRRGVEDVFRGLGDARFDGEARVLGATVEDVMLLDVYVVNGRSVGSEAYRTKLAWLERLRDLLHERYDLGEKVVVTGDFNVAPEDRDVHDPDAWRERILCSSAERRAFFDLVECGFADALRKFTDEAGIHTWWDFRTFAFRKGNGLRIDHFLLSPPALEACRDFTVDLDARKGKKPSDHAPVLIELGA